MACHVTFHHTLKQCSHPFGHLNSMPNFSEILSVMFYYVPYTTTLFAWEPWKPFKQSILHITMFCTNILICFEAPPPCRVCYSTDISLFRYVNKVGGGNPHICHSSFSLLFFKLPHLLRVFQHVTFLNITSTCHTCFMLMDGLRNDYANYSTEYTW